MVVDSTAMTTQAIHGGEVVDLIESHPDGIRLGMLMELVVRRFGEAVVFHTSSAAGLDFDSLMSFLEARERVRISRGVVYPAEPAA